MGVYFSPIGGGVLKTVSEKIGRKMKDVVVSVKYVARKAFYSNIAALRSLPAFFPAVCG
jgi:hypothetical protein